MTIEAKEGKGLYAPALLAIVQGLENRRAAAMVAGDLDALENVLDLSLLYSHSTGAVDDQSSFLEHIRSGYLRYVDVVPLIDHAVELTTDTLVGVGRLQTKVQVAGTLKELDARYMTIWRRTGEDWAMAALQG